MNRMRWLSPVSAMLVGLALAACSSPLTGVVAPPTPEPLPTMTPRPAATLIARATQYTPPAKLTVSVTAAATQAVTPLPTPTLFSQEYVTPTTAVETTPAPGVEPTGAALATGPVLTITSRTANVRAGPGTTHPLIGSTTQGKQFTITGKVKAGEWWQVDYNGKPGWIAASVASAANAGSVADVANLPTPPPAPTAAPAATGAAAAPGAPAAAAAPPKPAAGGGSGRIVFASGNGDSSDIAVLDVATGKITTVIDHGRQPDMRFDGHIVFRAIGNGRNDLYMIWPDGSQLSKVGARSEFQYPQWAPTKTGLAFFTQAPDQDLVCIQWDITQPVGDPIMRTEYIPDLQGVPRPVAGRYPTWITNDRIAFAGCDSWLQGSNCGIWAIDTGKWRDFRPYPLTNDLQHRPSDNFGDTLLYSSSASGNWEIYAVNSSFPTKRGAPKPVPVNLTNNGAPDVGGTFSPDGRQIAFISNRGGWGIWVMNADGSGQRQLAAVPQGFGPGWDAERLSWAP